MTKQELTRALQNVAGRDHVLTSSRETKYYRRGFRSGEGEALAVVFPTTLWVQWQVLEICINAGALIIMQAAKTGLTEGSSPNGYDYDRPVVIINGKLLDKLVILNGGSQILAFPGTTLFQTENSLKPLKREPHSVIGSSCIGASVIGGIANNSGGALVQRGPAYTELSLFAQVNAKGELCLVNHLGIELGESPEEIINNLENYGENATVPEATQLASDKEYIERVRDVDAQTPARFNADPRRHYEASGCAGKLAVFAVRLDTFKANDTEKVFYIAINKTETLTKLRRDILNGFQILPVSGEYVHRTAFELARKYGKDTFLAIEKLGTGAMPRMFALRGYMTDLLNSIPFFPKDFPDKLMQFASKLFPEHLPKRMLTFHEKYEHHLIVKMAGSGIVELNAYLSELFGDEGAEGGYFACTKQEGAKAMLHRFAVAGAAVRCLQMRSRELEDIVALDIALRRNETEWFESLPKDLQQQVEAPIYYGHFFCHVFHQDYLVKKGFDPHEVKKALLAFQADRGAEFPAEHNVGHLYEAPEQMQAFYKQLDPTNTFNPGVGKMSKDRRYGCC